MKNVTEEMRKAELARLELQWQEENRKIKKYNFLLKAAQDRRREIEDRIKKV